MSSASIRVEKATSDLLIGPDWTMNMEICDSVNSDYGQAKEVCKVVKRRLQHKNPKVQLLALTLLETMIKNCGDYVHHQVAERNILPEMIKIVRKKCDMQVRDKILMLLDSWQEAFGGPRGKFPQYYWAYDELRRSGVEFPERSVNAAPIFTPPVTHPAARQTPAGYGMPSNTARRLDEAMASDMANLSLSDLGSMRSVMELLGDMLQAVDPNDHEAVKDEVIVDLVAQCHSNQKKLMQMVNSTGDEELLGQGLALNDSLQSLLAKHDAIASGSLLPSEAINSKPAQNTSPVAMASPATAEAINSSPRTDAIGTTGANAPGALVAVAGDRFEEEDEEDDDFAQLARRFYMIYSFPIMGESIKCLMQCLFSLTNGTSEAYSRLPVKGGSAFWRSMLSIWRPNSEWEIPKRVSPYFWVYNEMVTVFVILLFVTDCWICLIGEIKACPTPLGAYPIKHHITRKLVASLLAFAALNKKGKKKKLVVFL